MYETYNSGHPGSRPLPTGHRRLRSFSFESTFRRMKPSLIAVLFAAILSIFALPGCPAFSKACGAALPVLNAGHSYAADAQLAIDQVQRLLDDMPTLDAAKKRIVQDGIDKARTALRAADTVIATTSEACSAPDVLKIFEGFNAAWSLLKGLIGSNVGAGLIGVAPGSAKGIVDPAIYLKAGGT